MKPPKPRKKQNLIENEVFGHIYSINPKHLKMVPVDSEEKVVKRWHGVITGLTDALPNKRRNKS